MYKILTLLSVSLLFLFPLRAGERSIILIKIDGSINPASYEYIHKNIKEAEETNAECLIIQLNTPGGLLKSTRYIVTDILSSSVPVIVYVSPAGSQSGSAGVFITLAANIAAMAPGTNIGASHPVDMQGNKDSIMSEKATNDAAAFIRTISEKRKRNLQWAEDAVRKSVSITETEALKLNVIDLVAVNIEDLLNKINGKEVETSKGKIILNTGGAQITYNEMTWLNKLLDLISDPNISYILMMLGIWGIILEFYHPGAILPGIVGAISLILALYGLHTLPLNYAGLALIILSIILFILEIKVVSHGLLSIGAVISLVFGSFMLFNVESGLEVIKVSTVIIILTALTISLLFIILIFVVIKSRKRKITTGYKALINEIAEVYQEIKSGKQGVVKVRGEMWSAEQDGDEMIKKGSKVKITDINNFILKVQKI